MNRTFRCIITVMTVSLIASTYIFFSSLSVGAQERIKIGHINVYSGPQAIFGEEHEQGIKLYFDQINWRSFGKQIELISEDSEGKPAEALQKARKLTEKDKVNLLMGITQTPVAIAMRDYIHEAKVPLIVSSAAGHDIISCQKRSKYLFRSNYSYACDEYPIADYMVKNEGKKNVIIGAVDFVAGMNFHIMGRAFPNAGGKVVQTFSFPFNTIDFLPYFTNLKVSEADAIWVFCPGGSDAIRFVTQWQKTGMSERLKLYGSNWLVPTSLLSEQKDAALGIICSGHYFPEINNPENVSFVGAYRKKYGKNPSHTVEHGYTGARVIAEALKATKGETKDLEKLLSAIQNVQFDAPRGKFRFEKENNTVINTIYVAKVVRKGDGYGYEILKQIPDVKFSSLVPILYPGYVHPKI